MRVAYYYALTHVYSGYPAIKEAKERIQRGELGKLRKILVEYLQGWLSSRVELNEGSNASWRTDPKRSGKAGSMGDICLLPPFASAVNRV